MKARLLKDTPDLKAGAIFESLEYNASTSYFIDNFDDYRSDSVFNFLKSDDVVCPDSVDWDDYIWYTKRRILDLVKEGWFEIIEDELTD